MMIRVFTYRLTPTLAQAQNFARTAGSCRWVYNGALAIRERLYRETGKALSYSALCKWLSWNRNRADLPWLSESPSVAQQQALRDLADAYSRFFKGQNRRPTFKRKGRARESFRVTKYGVRVERLSKSVGRIRLPGVGWVRLRYSRPLDARICNATIYRRAGRWYVSVCCEADTEPAPANASGGVVGLDMGIARTITTSDGATYQAPAQDRVRLRRLQKSLSLKQGPVKGKRRASKNWRKALARLQRFKAREADKLRDFHHQTTTALIRENQAIVVEELVVSRMTRRARGKGRASKAGLNRSILAQGWSAFRQMLEQKGAHAGVTVVAVPPAYTSQTCHHCGYTACENRKSQAVFACVSCGHRANADVNAARNILKAAGLAVSACGDVVRPRPVAASVALCRLASVKQEPNGSQLCLF